MKPTNPKPRVVTWGLAQAAHVANSMLQCFPRLLRTLPNAFHSMSALRNSEIPRNRHSCRYEARSLEIIATDIKKLERVKLDLLKEITV
jgi:hypothetical protein